jgi:ribonuclease D
VTNAAPDAPADAAPDEAPLLPLRDGIPDVIADAGTLAAAADALSHARGPVAVDAERASSYRYGHRAYLVQLRRDGAGTLLIDPIACPDLSSVGEALRGSTWVLHAANQDLPCLADLGMTPDALFDTELAGRLAGLPRVGLAALVEARLGWRLEKGHSAADWSQRPLPESWLRYAALDVEMLLELRDSLATELEQQGKLGWALEEFEHVRTCPPAAPATDRWRRVSGLHRVRNRRQLAVVREMWQVRDDLASDLDVSPTRLLPDASIVHVALHPPASARALGETPEFVGRGSRRHLQAWWGAISRALALGNDELPDMTRPHDGPPPAHRWAERDRAAADRLAAARTVVAALADEHAVPAENLMQPDMVRRLAWAPPEHVSVAAVAQQLRDLGARPWQIDLAAEPLAKALVRLDLHG